MSKWHERLRYERQSRGWTQSSLAEKVGTNTYTISRWENGNAFPHPFYREKLTTLLGISFEVEEFLQDDPEFDHNTYEHSPLPSQVEQMHHERNASLSLLTSVAQPQLATSLVQGPLAHKQDMYAPQDYLLSSRSPRDIHTHVRYMSAFGSFKQFSRHCLPLVSMILLATLIVIALNRPFLLRNTPTHVEKQSYTVSGPVPHTLTIQHINPSLNAIVQNLTDTFNAVYPQLDNRFAFDPSSATVQNVTLTFSSDLASPASISGPTITLSSDWIRQHPNDIGLLTHELTLLTQAYPVGAPGWFSDGMADYARYVYGPADDDDWSLPDGVQPQDSYTQGGGVAARFLLWLEQHTTPDIIDQLNHALQTKQSFSDTFRHLTHQTVDDLWSQYQAHPDISQTPEQLYKTFTSRKPLYQLSSYRLQALNPGTWNWFIIPGFSVSNFAMQANLTSVSGDGGGFIFRLGSQNHASYRHYRLRLFPNGNFDLVTPSHKLVSDFNTAIREGYGQTNQLTIIAHKHTIYMYINGQLITTVNDATANYGAVGLMANDETNATDVRFEHVKVF